MKSVLLIDDDQGVRTVLGEMLKRNGWQVWEAPDGETGLSLARQHRPDAVLCDLLMPRANGFQVCSAIRKDPVLQHVRLVAISGNDFSVNRVSALEAGADDFLAKPITPRDLLGVLDRPEPGARPAGSPAFQTATRRRTRVKFWGVRGSIPTPGPATAQFGGNTSCLEVRADDEIIILDSGTGIRPLGLELAAEFKGRPLAATILITHTHWDHIQGFPFFVPAYDANNQIRVLGYEGAREGLAPIFAMQMESPFFPIGLKELPAHIAIEEMKEMEFPLGKVRVKAAFANHPGVCVGYRLFTSQGSLAYVPDHEPSYHRHRHPKPMRYLPAAMACDENPEDQQMLELLRGADVLVMDSQYDADEYRSHMGWGHGCVDEVVALAIRAQVKQLYLFHHDPEHDDAKVAQMLEHARRLAAAQGASLAIEAAREGDTCELPVNLPRLQ